MLFILQVSILSEQTTLHTVVDVATDVTTALSDEQDKSHKTIGIKRKKKKNYKEEEEKAALAFLSFFLSLSLSL